MESTIFSDQAKIHNENDCDNSAPMTHSFSARPKPSNRHVRFPEDESIILGCLEPFYPTPDNCTSDELIAAYISACKFYKAPPVDFLLEQLRGIDLSICNERYSRLCLRGIRLNRYQVETLEEVFRRVHFQEVDLEDTFLDEPSATALFDMMLHYETCVDLSISLSLERSNSSVAWSRCITYLRKSSVLRRFRLSHTPLTANLFNNLSFSGLSLQSLTFRDCSLTGAPLHYLLRILRFLMTYTASSTTSTTSKSSSHSGPNANRYPRPSYRGPMAPVPWALILRLPENRINALDAENLLLLVRHQLVILPGPPTPLPPSVEKDFEGISVPTNKPAGGSGYLEELDLSHNSLRDEGVQKLCAGLLQAYQLQHRRLEVTLKAIAQATNSHSDPASSANITIDLANLPPKCALPRARGLQRLSLADNALSNGGGVGGAGRHLAAVLRCSTERLAPLLGGLTFLDLSDNPGLGDEGVIDLCEGLIRNFTMKELYLRNVKIQFDGVFALSGYIGETRSLVNLDIRQNDIDLACIMAITRTLKVNRSLHSLLLDSQSSSPSTVEENEMRQIFLKELSEYLMRNRNTQLQPEPDIFIEARDESNTFSPNIQRAVERIPYSPIPDDINNRKLEDEEIKETLLDSPKPPSHISPRGPTHVQNMAESSSQLVQLKHAVRTDLLTTDKTNTCLQADQPAIEASVGMLSIDATKIPITVKAALSEEHHPTEEFFVVSENRKLDIQKPAVSAEIPLLLSEAAAFKGLGDEPPMEFETFLKEHGGSMIEMADIPTSEEVDSHLLESEYPSYPFATKIDGSSISPLCGFEPVISHTCNAPVSYSSLFIDLNRQSGMPSMPLDDSNGKKEDLGITSASRIENVNFPIIKEVIESYPDYEMSEAQFKQSWNLSRPEGISLNASHLTSKDHIGDFKDSIDFAESLPEIEVKVSANSELVIMESSNETSCLTPGPNTLSVMTTSQERSSSEDLLKEAMQQYRNADMNLENEPISAAPADFIRQEVETSESDDSLFNSSPPKSLTEGYKMALESGKRAEEELQAIPLGGERVSSGETEWDNERPENSPDQKTEHEARPLQAIEAHSGLCDPEFNSFVDQSDKTPLREENDTSFDGEHGYISEMFFNEFEHVNEEASVGGDALEGDRVKGENDLKLSKGVRESASLNALKNPDKWSIKSSGEVALDDSDLLSYPLSYFEIEYIPKVDYKGDKLILQGGVELGKVESHVEPGVESRWNVDEFRISPNVEKSAEESIEFKCENLTKKESLANRSESGGALKLGLSSLQAMLEPESDSELEIHKDTTELHEFTANEAKSVGTCDVFSSPPEAVNNVLLTPDWIAVGEVLVAGVLRKRTQNAEERGEKSSDDLKLERDDRDLAFHGESNNAKNDISDMPISSVSDTINTDPTDRLEVVNASSMCADIINVKQVTNQSGTFEYPEYADFKVSSLDHLKRSDITLTFAPGSTYLETEKVNITHPVSFERPQTRASSLYGSSQIRARMDEETRMGSLTFGDSFANKYNTLPSGSNLADHSKNDAYLADFDPSEQEFLSPSTIIEQHDGRKYSRSAAIALEYVPDNGWLVRERSTEKIPDLVKVSSDQPSTELVADVSPPPRLNMVGNNSVQWSAEILNVKEEFCEVDQAGPNEKSLPIPVVTAKSDELSPIIKTTLDDRNKEEEFNQARYTEGSVNIEADFRTSECEFISHFDSEGSNLWERGSCRRTFSQTPISNFNIGDENPIQQNSESREDLKLLFESHTKASVGESVTSQVITGPDCGETEGCNMKKLNEETFLKASVTTVSHEPNPKIGMKNPSEGSSEDLNQRSRFIGLEKGIVPRDHLKFLPGSLSDENNLKLPVEVQTPPKDIPVLVDPDQWQMEDWKSEKCQEDASSNAPAATEERASISKTEKKNLFGMSFENSSARRKPVRVDQVGVSKNDSRLRPVIISKSPVESEAGVLDEVDVEKPAQVGFVSKYIAEREFKDYFREPEENTSLNTSLGIKCHVSDPQMRWRSPFRYEDRSSEKESADRGEVIVSKDDLRLRHLVGVKGSKEWEADVLDEVKSEASEDSEGKAIELQKSLAITPIFHAVNFGADILSPKPKLAIGHSIEGNTLTGFAGQPGIRKTSFKVSTPAVALELENPAFGTSGLPEIKNSIFQETEIEEMDSKKGNAAGLIAESENATLTTEIEIAERPRVEESKSDSAEWTPGFSDWIANEEANSSALGEQSEFVDYYETFDASTSSMDYLNAIKIDPSGYSERKEIFAVKVEDEIFQELAISPKERSPKDIIPTSIDGLKFSSKVDSRQWKVNAWKEVKMPVRSGVVGVPSGTPEDPRQADSSKDAT